MLFLLKTVKLILVIFQHFPANFTVIFLGITCLKNILNNSVIQLRQNIIYKL